MKLNKKILIFASFFLLACSVCQGQERGNLRPGPGGPRKEEPRQKTIKAGGEVAFSVPRDVLDRGYDRYKWEIDDRKLKIISYDKSSATFLGIASTPSTVINYKYFYKVKDKDGKDKTESATIPFTVTILKVAPTSIDVRPETTVGWGVNSYLSYRLWPEYSEADMHFLTDNPNVVTINSSGNAYGVALGEANVYVKTDNGLEAVTHVTCVIPEVSNIKVKGYDKKQKLYVGDELQLEAEYSPVHSEPSLTWSSSDETKATVDAYGYVKIVGKGTVHIICKDISGVKGDVKLKSKER